MCTCQAETINVNTGQEDLCGNVAEDKCEICNKKYCINCMYLTCKICHIAFTCFWCGFPLKYKLEKCLRHCNEFIEKCEVINCCCKDLSKI